MERNCENEITFHDICTEFSLERFRWSKSFFRKARLRSDGIFLQPENRTRKAADPRGRRNITEIAEALSYSSVYYFSRAFKKSTGMTPTEYAASVKAMYEEHNVPIPAEAEP